MEYGVLHKAWYKIGADFAGLNWNKFVEIIQEKIQEKEL